ncbi:type II secretion system protein [Campylobacter sp. RM12654]|uniref:type II secretion system protein n=1 Tax=Campylobacter sp. RM12654 TaxID=2735738 RepID=UPI00301577F6|nr:type II secretion system protein [Campylobacter sp. RM12654]
MKKAFSMIEMIFAIAVIGILAGIAIPKMMANKDTAHIVQLKEQVEAIRKGIEAYAGAKYIETGSKDYPDGLCYNSSGNIDSCTDSLNKNRLIFQVVMQTPPVANVNWIGWTNSLTKPIFLYKIKKNIQKGYLFEYDKENGTFKCINSHSKCAANTCALPCKDLGE